MPDEIEAFYDDLAEHYHLIYEDWNQSIERQAGTLGPLLERAVGRSPLKMLDCACGIGTQTIGMARRGHVVVASDLSGAAVRRAAREAKLRGLDVRLHVADMRNLTAIPEADFDAVLAGDNSLPHLLSTEDLERALRSIAAKLKPSGVMLATVRDYDDLLRTRPAVQPPNFYSEDGKRRIVHQVWDWNQNEYTVHLYLTCESASGWMVKHYASRYRALKRHELSRALEMTGFAKIEWLLPEATSFYQPIVIARKSAGA